VLLANVPFIPSLFFGYQQEEISNRSLFVRSGILSSNAAISAEFQKGGKTIDLPFFGDLTGSSQLLNDTSGLSLNTISGGRQTGVRLLRGNAWQSSDLAAELSGGDPATAIARSTGRFWDRDMQKVLLNILKGLFDATGPLATSHTAGGTAEALSAGSMIDALAVLGDHGQDLETYVMHSKVYYALAKADLSVSGLFATSQIDTRVSQERPEFRTLFGRNVIVDDTTTVDTGAGTGSGSGKDVYRTYAFAPGAFAYAAIAPEDAVETDRISTKGIDVLINRLHYMIHPNGCRWVGTPAGDSPTDAELATPANWTKVFSDNKNIKVVQLRTYIA